MEKWGRNFFYKFRDKVKRQKEIIDTLVNRSDKDGVQQYFIKKNILDELLVQEELYWKQHAKVFWLTKGDTNSKIFHATASKRKRLNHITHLVNNAGETIVNVKDMNELVVSYFKDVFAGNCYMDNQEESEGIRVITTSKIESLHQLYRLLNLQRLSK